MTDTGEQISAQLVLKRADGTSILDAGEPVTAAVIARFMVPGDRIDFVRGKLENVGFNLPEGNATTLSVVGPRALFAEVFGLEVGTNESGVAAHATRIPDELSDHVADVFVTPAPEFFP